MNGLAEIPYATYKDKEIKMIWRMEEYGNKKDATL